MKFSKVALLLVSLFLFSQGGYAAPSDVCANELRNLVVPPLKGVAMNKKDIRAELDESSNGVYSVRLFVPADSPDNLDKQVSIGWVNLDIKSMKAFDVINDPDNHVELKVNKDLYRSFVKRCIKAVE